MKTRNIVLRLSLLLCAGSAAAQISLQPGNVDAGYGVAAQTHFYNETRTFYGSGFVYQANVNVHGCGRVILFNRYAGNFIDLQQYHRDGRLISDADRDRYDDMEEVNRLQMRELGHQIVRNGFSATEKSRLTPGERLGVILIICPDTGNVKEVHFHFIYDRSYATIPPATFRRIEQELKHQLRFQPTEFGRSMNFIFRGWRIAVVPILTLPAPDLADPTPDPDPGRPGPGTGIGDGGIGAP